MNIDRTTISSQMIDDLSAPDVKAIEFAEVGAQGVSERIGLVLRRDGRTSMIQGSFGFEFNGERYEGDVDLEKIGEKLPFLPCCSGTSPQTTVRGNFKFENGEWIHLDAGFGNHFFLRAKFFESFAGRLKEGYPHPQLALYEHGCEAILDVLESEE